MNYYHIVYSMIYDFHTCGEFTFFIYYNLQVVYMNNYYRYKKIIISIIKLKINISSFPTYKLIKCIHKKQAVLFSDFLGVAIFL